MQNSLQTAEDYVSFCPAKARNCILFLFLAFFALSCNSGTSSNSEDFNITDSNTEMKDGNYNISNEKIDKSIRESRNDEFMSDSLILYNEKIIYDNEFRPSVLATIKNKMHDKIVAVEVIINPNISTTNNCDLIRIVKKVSIFPQKEIILKELITQQESNFCKLETANIYLGEFVLSNGKKTSLQMLYFESMNK